MKRFTVISVLILLLGALLFTGCKKDKTAPEITLLGFNPYTVCVGSPYNDPGATAVDDEDGDITDKINVVVNVDTSQESEGTVTYEVSDEAGNTTTAVREVIVIFCE
jgi:hypothetical protein